MSLGPVETMSTEGEYDARIVAHPDGAEAWLAKAKLRLSRGDHQAGVEFAIAAASRAGAVPEAGRLLVEAAARAGDAHLLGLAAKCHLQLFPDDRETSVFQRLVPPRLLVPTPQDAEELDAFNQILASIRDRRPRRYGQLLQCLLALRPRSILEIGVFDGRNAADMIRAGGRTPAQTGALRYVGFDLFEEMTPEVHEKEFSKYPLSRAEIGHALSAFNQNHLLIQGYTQDTLKAFRQSPDAGPIDFVFIDGGHSEETIQSDWDNVALLMSEKTVVIFDDCYLNKVKELDGLGCNSLVERLARDPRYVVEMLPVHDSFDKDFGMLTIALVKVRLRPHGGALRRLLRINPWGRPATGRS
ncbi:MULTISPECIES: class I SAM-dependent methyltransferase [Nitrospirillum]|nr:class I SAM-dependent methyltransferase [Nitrospirillum amazonense]MEC4590387.1 class I SAM-dependent methyltransferase [Nitrospirillum amazonense]